MEAYTEQGEPLPLTSTFAMNLALHSVLSEACRILDDPDSDPVDRIMAEQTIQTVFENLELEEQ
jgi:PIN domain nuclease of toxin-antitoxin system